MSISVVIVALACVLGTYVVQSICRTLYSVYTSQLGVLRGPESPGLFYGHVNVACRAENSTITQHWIARYGTNVLCRWLCGVRPLIFPCQISFFGLSSVFLLDPMLMDGRPRCYPTCSMLGKVREASGSKDICGSDYW